MIDSLLRFKEDVLQKLNIKKEVLELMVEQTPDENDLIKAMYKSKLQITKEIIKDIEGIEVEEYDY